MSARKATTKAEAAVEETTEAAVTAEETIVTTEAETTAAAAAPAAAAGAYTFPVVYCGPSVKGVAKQYTIYKQALPEIFEKFLGKYPLAKKLVVPTARFAQTRKNLGTAGTSEYAIYKRLVKQLS